MGLKRTPLRRSAGTRIPDSVRREVHDRDRGCVAERAGFREAGGPERCSGRIEQNHIRSGGTGMKSKSEPWNLVDLCWADHRWATENGRVARPLQIDYLAKLGIEAPGG